MAATADQEYARTLVQMARADAQVACGRSTPGSRRAVALWMAEELARESEQLAITNELAESMRMTAREIRDDLRRAAPRRRAG